MRKNAAKKERKNEGNGDNPTPTPTPPPIYCPGGKKPDDSTPKTPEAEKEYKNRKGKKTYKVCSTGACKVKKRQGKDEVRCDTTTACKGKCTCILLSIRRTEPSFGKREWEVEDESENWTSIDDNRFYVCVCAELVGS